MGNKPAGTEEVHGVVQIKIHVSVEVSLNKVFDLLL